MAKNRIQKFIDETFGFKTRGRWLDGQAWLYAVDVCKALQLSNVSQAVASLDDDEKKLLNNTPPTIYSKKDGRGIARLLVNEPGFYRLIFKSRTTKAKEFQRWVFHKVLPAIRLQGQWQEARDGGKVTRRTFTDVLAELFTYSIKRDEFHHEDTILYTNYTKLVNKAVGVEAGERDTLTAQKLFEIEQCEKICAKIIDAGMSAEKPQSEIYEACKEKLNAWKDLTE